jgi:hypothetical protein
MEAGNCRRRKDCAIVEYCAAIDVIRGVQARRSKAFTTGGTEDHSGKWQLMNVALLEALH